MSRRMSNQARRAEILKLTRQMIAEQGPEGLSLRAVASYCGLSAPGLLHHFDGLQPLLESVLSNRHEEQLQAYLAELPANPSLRDWADTVTKVAAQYASENHKFDALETEAIANPNHPAHNYFQEMSSKRPFPMTIELARKDYPKNPELVVEVLSTVVDGLRLRWLRSVNPPSYLADWNQIADAVFAGFKQYQ